MTTSSGLGYLFLLGAAAFILRYVLVPFLLESLLQVQIRSVSPRSVRGIEWSPKNNAHRTITSRLKIERIGLQRSKRKGGLLTISVEGLTVYVTKDDQARQADTTETRNESSGVGTTRSRSSSDSGWRSTSWGAKLTGTLKAKAQAWTVFYMSLAVQQSPWLAHLMDLRVEKAVLAYQEGSEPPIEFVMHRFNACFDVIFDQAPELIVRPDAACYAGINTPSGPRSPFIEPKSPMGSPNFVTNHGLLSPPPSLEALANEKPVTPNAAPGITKSRPARILSRLLGRARGNATLTMEMGQVSLTEKTPASTMSNHVEKVFELVDDSRLEVTVQFGDKAGILGENSVDVKLNVSPVSVNILRVLTLQERLKGSFPRRSGQKRNRPAAQEARIRDLLNALHSVQLALPYSTARIELEPDDYEKTAPAVSGHFDFAVNGFFVDVRSTSPSSNSRLKDIFGRNQRQEALIPAVHFSSSVADISVIWQLDRSPPRKVLDIGNLELDGVTTWRLPQWRRCQILFSDDPNRYIVAASFNVERLHVKTSVPMMSHLRPLLKRVRKDEDPVGSAGKLAIKYMPRILFDGGLGHSTFCILSSDDDSASLLEISSNGVAATIMTDYRDICATRKTRARDAKAFDAAHEALEADAGPSTDGTPYESGSIDLSERAFTFEAGVLQDDATISMHWECSLRPGTMSAIVSLAHAEAPAYELLKIGNIDVHGEGIVKGGPVDPKTCHDLCLWWQSGIGALNVALQDGIQVTLWHQDAQDHLHHIVHGLESLSPVRSNKVKHPRSHQNPILARLPSGFRLRIAIPNILVLLASRDLNPACRGNLQRGLQLQMGAILDYCAFNHVSQTRRNKLDGKSNSRRRLRLPADATEQAIALHNEAHTQGARAAHCTMLARQIVVLPVYNAAMPNDRNRPNPKPVPNPASKTFFPRRTRMPSYAGWDFQRVRDQPKPSGDLANGVDPFPISLRDQAQKPLLHIYKIDANVTLRETCNTGHLDVATTIKVAKTKLSADISHVYCALLALEAFPRTHRSEEAKESRIEPQQSSSGLGGIGFGLKVNVEEIMGDLALPLKERLFFDLKSLAVSSTGTHKELSIDSSMFYVPSPRAPGRWEEFGRVRRFEIAVDNANVTKPIANISIATLRIRIPFRYELSKLVLNFSTLFKAIKLLREGMRKKEFVTVRKPSAQPPKIVPETTITIDYFSFEIKDDPLETKLNLIWRVGLNEQADRLERMEAFAAKVAVLESAARDTNQGPLPSSNLDEMKDRWGFDASGIRDIHDAAYNLAWYSARAWKIRFDKALATQNRREELLIALIFGIRNRDDNLPIDVMPPERFAPLFRAKFEKLTVELKPLDLDKNGIIKYMEGLAGPFPTKTDFSLLVPLEIDLRARSVDLTLRDYPMPLFQIRPTDNQASDKQDAHSFQASITLVAGEELADDDSYVLLACPVLPENLGGQNASGLTVQVAKTLMPVKTYTRMKMKVATGAPTDFTWGNSYQPAIEDLTKAFEKFTHPPRDPSPKMGFWDKFRLTLHWRIAVDFDGPCHLHLKGSRDPYHITGFGAGFVLAWMGNVKLRIGEANEQRELIQISSDEMFFSIPDLSAMIDNAATGTHSDANSDAGKPASKLPSLLDRRGTKTCARFVGGVRVGFGFKFERTCRDHTCSNECRGGLSERRCRMFDFKPHHQVKMRTQAVVDAQSRELGRPVDSYEGFRSDFIHFSPSITTFGRGSAGESRDENLTHSSSFHFTPKGFSHFFAWWRLFNHVMSLPIRQGKLFPKSPPPHRKFGRSLATIKYRFDISHLYISHFYPQMSKVDWTTGRQTAVGVKAHIKHFQADLHQREQTKIVRKEALQRMGTIKHKPFYAADIVLEDVQLRALSAVFEDQSKGFLIKHASHIVDVPDPVGTLADKLALEDAPWFNPDDFVDTDHRPSDGNPYIEMYEIGACPQFHYSRWLPALKLRPDVIDKMKTGHWYGTDMEASKFGREPSHWCLLDEYEGSHRVGIRLAEARRDRLTEALRNCTSRETVARDGSNTLSSKAATLQASIDVLNRFIADREAKEAREHQSPRESSTEHLDSRENETEGNDFQNIYQVYTPRLVLNNQSRNILLKYYFSSRLRKGLEYYLSNKALKVLREQLGSITDAPVKSKPIKQPQAPKIPNKLDWVADKTGNVVAKELLKLVLGDGDKLEHNEGDLGTEESKPPGHETDPHAGLPEEYTVTKSHFLSLFGPQLALSSELDEDSTILFCMDSATFKGYTIGDEDFVGDPVNSRVMHRNYSDLSGLQGFYPRRSPDQNERRDRTFVPLEVLLDSKCQSLHFDRVLPKTDGYFHYDKFNQLRLSNDLSADREQYGQEALPEHIQHKQDLAVLHVPRFAVMADSHHYTALYNVITNLILYQDPEQRQRSQKMDTFVYSFDRRDALRYVTEVTQLQQRIRESESLIKAYDEHYAHLTPEGKLGLIDVRGDLLASVESLNMIYDAVSLHRNYTERAAALKGSIRFQASAGEVAWYMFGQDALLAKLAMTDTHFDWLRKKDSSTDSTLVVKDLQALNSSPDAVFPEMLAKYQKSGAKESKPIMKVRWAVLAPVGGITIMERLHVDLHPVRVQLEKKLGRQLMEYVFGENGRPKKQATGHQSSKTVQGMTQVGPGDDLRPTHDGRKLDKSNRDQRENGSSLTRQNSSSDMPAADSEQKHVRRKKSGSSLAAAESEQPFLPFEADEMHSRATKNMTFVSISFVQTTLVLSYKGDKPKSLTDLYDFKFTCPELRYSNKTWSFENLFQHIRRDVIRSAWQQKGALIREVFKKNRKPTRMTAPENMLNGPSKLRTASRPFDRSPTLNGGQILESAPFVRSPVEEGDFGDLTRVPTTESFESGLGEREKPGKLGKLVHKIKARTTNRQQHGDDR